MIAWRPPATALTPARASALAGWLILLALAVWLSSSRFAAAPGFEFYLGPLFYLIAYRWFGLGWGLVTAALTMAPSILWWGHPVSLLLALGHVLTVAWFGRRQISFSTITFFYQITAGTTAALALLYGQFSTPIEVTAVVLLRKIMCEVLLAGFADLVTLFFVRGRDGRVVRAPALSLQLALDALVSLAVAGAATLFLLGTLTNFGLRLTILEDQIRNVVVEARRASPGGRLPEAIGVAGSEVELPLTLAPSGNLASGAQRLGCTRTDRGEPGGPDDRNTFTYWLRVCLVADTRDGQSVLVSPRPLVLESFRNILTGLVPIIAYLVLAQLVLMLFRAALRRSRGLLDTAVQGFAARRRIEQVQSPFVESTAVLNMLRTVTDEYLDADQERERLARTVDELRNAIDLRLLSGLRIGEESLHYVELTPGAGARAVVLPFNPADRDALTSLGGNDIMAEFRVAGSERQHWFLLLAHDYDPVQCEWRFGCLVRLRASEAMQTKMLHNARLIELGGMASALSHELRQPLFTISLAAENGAATLRRDPPQIARVQQKFDRILEQVARASAIIERTSAYAREERGDRQPTDLVQAIHDAARFMRPVLHGRGIELTIAVRSRIDKLMLPRIAVEQIIVNALQNAADSIDQARASGATAGSIAIEIGKTGDHATIAIRDDGAGLGRTLADSPFDAFSTSKPEGKGTGLGLFICRQIVDEIGGTIDLANNREGSGASLTLAIPLSPPWSN